MKENNYTYTTYDGKNNFILVSYLTVDKLIDMISECKLTEEQADKLLTLVGEHDQHLIYDYALEADPDGLLERLRPQ